MMLSVLGALQIICQGRSFTCMCLFLAIRLEKCTCFPRHNFTFWPDFIFCRICILIVFTCGVLVCLSLQLSASRTWYWVRRRTGSWLHIVNNSEDFWHEWNHFLFISSPNCVWRWRWNGFGSRTLRNWRTKMMKWKRFDSLVRKR